MNENGETSQTLYMSCAYSNMPNETVFHAVYVPDECNETSVENKTKDNIRIYQDKTEALKVIKEFKTGRLKTFKNRSDAEDYARTGSEKTNCVNNSSGTSTIPTVEEKSNNFKGPRTQELVCFRKLIKDGDLYDVKSTVWGNPRYLIGSGDTPAILQEGCRYNALHIAVRADRPDMCELILNTVGNAEFIKLLYGEECKTYLDRAQIMLDLYLNTPDKGLNETPLHFAVKFGLKDVVRILVSYPLCIKTLQNKYKQMPIEIICSRVSQDDEKLKKEIRMLLEDQYYVPVLRSEDTTLQPIIGEPFSPTNHMSMNRDPISPRLEVRAFAGPMTKSRAMEFRKKWKTPPRLRLTPAKKPSDNESDVTDDSTDSIALRLQDTEKGLERVGRHLAEEYQVPWKEYWPFLNDFADFHTNEGLAKLEKYLEHKFLDTLLYCGSLQNLNDKTTNVEEKLEAVDEMDVLCNKLETVSLAGNDDQEENNMDDQEFFTPPSSPKLILDSSDDEMEIAEEGPSTFLEGSVPTKLDHAVYNAIPSSINENSHPNIYRWQHDVHLALKRSYRPNNTRLSRRKLFMTS